jgi:mannose-6-phosphate isomerase-like protein (cupin superfamily)
MKLIKEQTGFIDLRDTMYPCTGTKVHASTFTATPYSTVYGFAINGEVVLPNGWVAKSGQYFCYAAKSNEVFEASSTAVFIERLGFLGQNTLGGPIEESGRLCYIDGCSDSLLVYPPRCGDPSLNMLYFPEGIDQSFHIHPSVRLGIVVSGTGKSTLRDKTIDLEVGDMFCIEEREYHRFKTELGQTLTVIAFHPDGDWGPTDQNHTMLNRTYITGKN